MPDTETAHNAIRVRRYRAIEDHLFSDLAEEAVILSLRNGKYYGINHVGASIWWVIQQPATLAEVESHLMKEYDVDEETCRAEVALFLETMMREKLIDVFDE
ncbi:MAG: lasso peptide biosynthesis PqqD family chaperone [Pyrinomonadaceae bacterium]